MYTQYAISLYTISLTALIALTGSSSWSAGWDEQNAQRKIDKKIPNLSQQDERPTAAIVRADIPQIPYEVFVEHMFKYMSAATLMNLAVALPKLYPFIKTNNQFMQLQQYLTAWQQKYNLEDIFLAVFNYKLEAINNPVTIDVTDYLSQYISARTLNIGLVKAAIRNSTPMIQLLLDKGADIASSSSFGAAVLGKAVEHHNAPMIQMLLNKKADINVKDANGRTALLTAAFDNDAPGVKMLVDYRADISLTNNDGYTALNIAQHKVETERYCQSAKDEARKIIDLLTKD